MTRPIIWTKKEVLQAVTNELEWHSKLMQIALNKGDHSSAGVERGHIARCNADYLWLNKGSNYKDASTHYPYTTYMTYKDVVSAALALMKAEGQ